MCYLAQVILILLDGIVSDVSNINNIPQSFFEVWMERINGIESELAQTESVQAF